MTHVLKGHFDGKVIVPEAPIDLPRNERLIIRVETDQAPAEPAHGTAEFIERQMQNHRISDEDAELMRAAIEECCERIDAPPDVDFD